MGRIDSSSIEILIQRIQSLNVLNVLSSELIFSLLDSLDTLEPLKSLHSIVLMSVVCPSRGPSEDCPGIPPVRKRSTENVWRYGTRRFVPDRGAGRARPGCKSLRPR